MKEISGDAFFYFGKMFSISKIDMPNRNLCTSGLALMQYFCNINFASFKMTEGKLLSEKRIVKNEIKQVKNDESKKCNLDGVLRRPFLWM